MVVWACSDEEYTPELEPMAGLPWAVEDVQVLEPAHA